MHTFSSLFHSKSLQAEHEDIAGRKSMNTNCFMLSRYNNAL
jgi:hypothetical protein